MKTSGNWRSQGRSIFATAALLLSSAAGALAHGMPEAAMWEGPGVMSASADGVAIWQFADRRALDPALFGTPGSTDQHRASAARKPAGKR